jgi:hypothetical protein
MSRLSAIVGLSFLLIITSSAVAQQSLGDVARKANKNKPAGPTTKVITNDDLNSYPAVADKPSDQTATDGKDENKDKAKAKEADKSAPEDQAKLDKEWEDKIAAQKDQIELLKRELDVLQRENKLRSANYYADAGTRLRDEKKYAEDDRKYRDQIDAKQKAIDDAKSKLDQMREEARKAGASPGAIS